jgi:hypothetical protein
MARPPEPSKSHGAPKLEVHIRILDDGRVVFGDLPPALAEVAGVLAGVSTGLGAGHRPSDPTDLQLWPDRAARGQR